MIALTIFSALIILSTSILIASTSLPLQAFALFFISILIASISGMTLSPLIGIYIVLIYSRGLLVLLAYFVALSPDQTLNTPSPSFFLSIALIIIFFISLTSINLSRSQNFSLFDTSSNIITILNPSCIRFLITIGLVLILTMVTVIKILSLRRSPIRPWS